MTTTEFQLTELRRDIDAWRETHRPPAAMPLEFWSAAASLAAEIGVSTVVAKLGVNRGKLRRLKNQLTAPETLVALPRQGQAQTARATFIEVPAATVARSLDARLACLLEVEAPGRGRLCAKLENATALDVATILREFTR